MDWIHEVSSLFLFCDDQISDRNSLQAQRFAFISGSRNAVHHGGEGMVAGTWQSWPHLGRLGTRDLIPQAGPGYNRKGPPLGALFPKDASYMS